MKLTALLFAAVFFAASDSHTTTVKLERVPGGGLQPQAAVDDRGTVHLVYFSGDPPGGDLFYVHSDDDGVTFSRPLMVNGVKGSAVAVGNIRGAHIAIGKNRRVHVAWNGSKKSLLEDLPDQVPMLYTRLNDSGTAFEPERNLIHSAYGLDGGGALAGDSIGNIYVFWHAPSPGTEGEGNRRVWVARSVDNGRTFEPERRATDIPTGACGCCGMSATADAQGNVFALYRSATNGFNRDMYLLQSHDRGISFTTLKLDPWMVGYCVMSSASFTSPGTGVLAAWETNGRIHFGRVEPTDAAVPRISAAPGNTTGQKHPAIAVDRNGNTILAWTEGMGWKKGGSLVWQVYDKDGTPDASGGRADGVPAWSLVAAVPRRGGGFTIFY